jgi:hypothetical protein
MKGSCKLKIHILFYGDSSWTAARRQTKFSTVKDHGREKVLFEWLHCLTKLAMVRNLEFVLEKMLNHSA